MKDYYFYPPNPPQFFFPKKEFKEFISYYTPFSIKSKVFWFLYKNSVLARSFFRVSEKKIPLPIKEIKEIINLKNATYFYNIGTEGIEQSATIIAKNKNEQLFLKFSEKPRAKELIVNEATILSDLEKQTTLRVAKIYGSNINDNYAYILTEVIEGGKINFTKLTNSVFRLLLTLAKNEEGKENVLKRTFAHGDFCPWNILQTKNNELILIDWEMAGLKPLGYDLFTYLFQTNFLLFPTKKIETIILENKHNIERYFNEFKIEDWQNYLIKFAAIKITEEKRKEEVLLLQKYQELHNYNGQN